MFFLNPLTKPLLGLTGTILTTLIIAAPSLSATLSFATTRSDLNGNDALDWASLGPVAPPQPFKVLPSVFTAVSAEGLAVNVKVPLASNPGITPPLLFQTTATGIPTNFAAGAFVLFTGLLPTQFPAPGNPGPLTLSFDIPVAGVGTQLAVDDVLQFTAFVAAFDSSDQLLGRFAASGTSLAGAR